MLTDTMRIRKQGGRHAPNLKRISQQKKLTIYKYIRVWVCASPESLYPRRFSQTAWGQPLGTTWRGYIRPSAGSAPEEHRARIRRKETDTEKGLLIVFFYLFFLWKREEKKQKRPRIREKSRERQGLKMGGLRYKTKPKKERTKRRNTLLLLLPIHMLV